MHFLRLIKEATAAEEEEEAEEGGGGAGGEEEVAMGPCIFQNRDIHAAERRQESYLLLWRCPALPASSLHQPLQAVSQDSHPNTSS